MNNNALSPKAQAISLMAEIATTRASLREALAPYETQLAALNASISIAKAPHEEKLEKLKAEAEALGLSECVAVFGTEHVSLISNGLKLSLSESDAVACDDLPSTIKRLMKEAGKAHLVITDEDGTEGDRIAALGCLRINVELNKAYIQSVYEGHEAWFNARGITLEDRRSVKLADAPKPRIPKPKVAKKVKTETIQQETA